MELKSNIEIVSKTIFAVDKTKASKIPAPVYTWPEWEDLSLYPLYKLYFLATTMYLLNRKLDKKRVNNKIINPYMKYSFIFFFINNQI
jgi:hypothetical protein